MEWAKRNKWQLAMGTAGVIILLAPGIDHFWPR